jgi:hypothetical protein
MNFRKWCLYNFCLSYYVPGQKPKGGAIGPAKRAGQRPDPKFDDYTQSSSEKRSEFKNLPQNNKRANRILVNF